MMQGNDFPILFLSQYHLEQPLDITHVTVDILFVTEGEVKITIGTDESRIYRSRDLLLLPPGRRYQITPSDDNLMIHLGLSASFVQSCIGADSTIVCDSVLEPNRNYVPLRRILSNIAFRYLDDAVIHQLSLYSLVYQLLDLLNQNYTLQLSTETPVENPRHKERLAEIQEYISRNYNRPLSLTMLADHLHLSPQYLSKLFHEYFHMKFNEYVNTQRVRRAERELIYSAAPITEIALNHGFPNVSAFHKYFRQIYNVSPREYRKLHTASQPTELELPQTFERNVSRSVEVPKEHRNIVADTSCSTDFSCNLCRMINIGFADNLLAARFQDIILQARKDLGFVYIRMEGLVSNALIPRLLSLNTYYFASVENILNFLQKQNFIPLIELGKNSYDYLQSNSNDWKFRGYSTSKKFHGMLDAFLGFVTSHYDSAWYSQWIFELWKSPDESLDSYIAGYQEISKIIRRHIPQALLGGPGHNTGYPSMWFTECLNAFHEHRIRPDFISVHFYMIQYLKKDNKRQLILPPDPDLFVTQQNWMLQQIRSILDGKIPLFITEFNSSLISGTYINASCYQAAFLCHNLLRLHGNSPMIGYWMLADASMNHRNRERYDFSEIGLINKSGVKMPSYYAYYLLNKLGHQLFEQGDGYCITGNGQGHYRILTWLYAHFSNFSFLAEEKDQSLRDVYKNYEKTSPVYMTFTLTGLAPGTYRVKRYLLDHFHGSYVDIQSGEFTNGNIEEKLFLYKMLTPSPKEIAYLSSACIPEERTIYINVENELAVTSPVYPHNICFWEITKEL